MQNEPIVSNEETYGSRTTSRATGARTVCALAVLFLFIVGTGCAPDAELATNVAEAKGAPGPGSTPPPGPVCRGPTQLENNLASPSGIEPALSVRSTTGPALVAHASGGANAGSFRSRHQTLEAHTTAPGAPALTATANAADAMGVEALTNSPDGVPLLMRSTGGADLLRATRVGESVPRFRIDDQAQVHMNGVLVPEFGPQGDPGTDGLDGADGAKGRTGTAGRGVTFALCSDATSCIGQCLGGWIAIEADGPCQVGADYGACDRAGHDGVCCVCGT